MKASVKVTVELTSPEGVSTFWKEFPESVEVPDGEAESKEWLSRMERIVHDAMWTVFNPRPAAGPWGMIVAALARLKN